MVCIDILSDFPMFTINPELYFESTSSLITKNSLHYLQQEFALNLLHAIHSQFPINRNVQHVSDVDHM